MQHDNDFFRYIKKSPRLFDGTSSERNDVMTMRNEVTSNEVTSNEVTSNEVTSNEVTSNEMHTEFFDSHVGSYITFMRKDIRPAKKSKKPRRHSIHNIDKVDESNNLSGSIPNGRSAQWSSKYPDNTDVLYMKVILSARRHNNVCCMVKVYNTDGVNIIDKWVIKSRAEHIMSKWCNMYPDSDIQLRFASDDKIKDCTELEDINSDDSTSPRACALKPCYTSEQNIRSSQEIISLKTKCRYNIVRKDHFSTSKSKSTSGLKKSPHTMSLSDLLISEEVDLQSNKYLM